MQTTNIVSTPNITGNIGSCKTEVAEVVSKRDSFWTQTNTQIATNSCTGEAHTYDTWGFTESGAMTLVFAPVFILLALAAAAS